MDENELLRQQELMKKVSRQNKNTKSSKLNENSTTSATEKAGSAFFTIKKNIDIVDMANYKPTELESQMLDALNDPEWELESLMDILNDCLYYAKQENRDIRPIICKAGEIGLDALGSLLAAEENTELKENIATLSKDKSFMSQFSKSAKFWKTNTVESLLEESIASKDTNSADFKTMCEDIDVTTRSCIQSIVEMPKTIDNEKKARYNEEKLEKQKQEIELRKLEESERLIREKELQKDMLARQKTEQEKQAERNRINEIKETAKSTINSDIFTPIK